ncbi:MAG: hypothetical protein HRT99_03720, partial [Mycoplasmatales bacterium]|nr:hypothetical protein [Mycoplasmatales bacterium]
MKKTKLKSFLKRSLIIGGGLTPIIFSTIAEYLETESKNTEIIKSIYSNKSNANLASATSNNYKVMNSWADEINNLVRQNLGDQKNGYATLDENLVAEYLRKKGLDVGDGLNHNIALKFLYVGGDLVPGAGQSSSVPDNGKLSNNVVALIYLISLDGKGFELDNNPSSTQDGGWTRSPAHPNNGVEMSVKYIDIGNNLVPPINNIPQLQTKWDSNATNTSSKRYITKNEIPVYNNIETYITSGNRTLQSLNDAFKNGKYYLKKGDKVKLFFIPENGYLLDKWNTLINNTTIFRTNSGNASGIEFDYDEIKESEKIVVNNPTKSINISGLNDYGRLDLNMLNLNPPKDVSLEIKLSKNGNETTLNKNSTITNLSNNDVIKFEYKISNDSLDRKLETNDLNGIIKYGPDKRTLSIEYKVENLGLEINVNYDPDILRRQLNGQYDHNGRLNLDSLYNQVSKTNPNLHIDKLLISIKPKITRSDHKEIIDLDLSQSSKILDKLWSDDEITFTFFPKAGYKIVGTNNLGDSYSPPKFVVPKLRTIDIANPLNNLFVSGSESHGVIDLIPLKLNNLPNHAQLEIVVSSPNKPDRIINPNETEINSLSNGDKIRFRYQSNGDYLFKDVPRGNGVGITTVSFDNNLQTYIVHRDYEFTVKGLTSEINVGDIDRKSFDNILKNQYDRHGSLDISSILNNKPKHIQEIQVKVNNNLVTGSNLENLSTKDQIEFIYVPEKNYKIKKTSKMGEEYHLPIYNVPKLRTIDIPNPLSKINLVGIESKGEIDLNSLNLNNLPLNTKLDIKIIYASGRTGVIPKSDWSKKITGLSNHDKVTFTYSTVGNYVITPQPSGNGVSQIKNVTINGQNEQQIDFTFDVRGLNNEIKVKDIDWKSLDSKLSGQYDRHGSLDISSILNNKPNHVKKIKVKVNNNLVTGSSLENLSTNDKIEFIYVPERNFKIKGTNNTGDELHFPIHKVPKLKKINIPNPLTNISLTGMETEGEVDLVPLNLNNIIDHTKLEISVIHPSGVVNVISPSDWSKKIANLSNHDQIKFTYTTVGNYLIKSLPIGNGVGQVKDVIIKGVNEQQINFIFDVSRLSNEIKVNDIDRNSFNKILSSQYDHHGSLDISSVLSNKPKHIKEIQVLVNGVVSGSILNGLSSNDQIEFIYVPEAKFKIAGENNAGDPHSLSIYKVPKLRTINIPNPLTNISLTGMETEGEVDLSSLNLSNLPDHTKLEVKVIRHSGKVEKILPNEWSKKITMLSNKDKIEFKYSTFGNYVITPIVHGNGVGLIKDIKINGLNEQQITFTYDVSGLSNEIKVNDIDRNSFNKALSGQYDRHGSLDIINILKSKPKHIQEIQVKVNNKLVTGSRLENLSTNDKIEFIYVPEAKFKIKGGYKVGQNYHLPKYSVPKLRTIKIANPLLKISLTGMETEGEVDLSPLNLSNLPDHTKLEVKVVHSSGAVDTILPNEWSKKITQLSNDDMVIFTYTTIDNYVIEPITPGGGVGKVNDINENGKNEQQIIFTYDVRGLSNEIIINDIDRSSFNKILSSQYDHHGSLDISSILNNKPKHIQKIQVKVNNKLVTGSNLENLSTKDQIEFIYVPEAKFKIKGEANAGDPHSLSIYNVPKLITINISNPLTNISLTGMETEGEIDLVPLKLSNLPNHIRLEVKVVHPSGAVDTILPNEWSKKIMQLSNNDTVTFTYTTVNDYSIEPLPQGNGIGQINNITENGKNEQQITFTYDVRGLSNEIIINDIDRNAFNSILSKQYDRHGSLDISSILNNKPKHIQKIQVKVNNKLVTGSNLENLSTKDQIEFIYVPEAKFKIKGEANAGDPHSLSIYNVPKLITINISNPLTNISLTGMETEGEIDLVPLKLSNLPNHIRLEVKVVHPSGAVDTILPNEWSKKIMQLSNNDIVTFTYTTVNDYIIEPLPQGNGIGQINNITENGKNEQQITFTFNVRGLSNKIKVNDINRAKFNKALLNQYENHGSLDISDILNSRPRHIKEIQVKVNNKLVTGSNLENLSTKDQIEFIYIPEAKFQIEGTSKTGSNYYIPIYEIPKLKLLKFEDPTKKMVAVGESGKAIIQFNTSNYLQSGFVTLKIVIKHHGTNMPDDVIRINSSDQVAIINNVSNRDEIQIIYEPVNFIPPKKEYVIDGARADGSIMFTYNVKALAVVVDNSLLLNTIKISGTNEVPIIDDSKYPNINDMHLEFSINSNEKDSWITKDEMIKYIKSTKGKAWKFPPKIYVRYNSNDLKNAPIIYKNGIEFAEIPTSNLKMIISSDMMEKLKNDIVNNDYISFKAGSTSSNVLIDRIDIATAENLKNQYGLKLIFSNDNGVTWSSTPLKDFNKADPKYWVALIPYDSQNNSPNPNESTKLMIFDNVTNNIIKLDTRKIPILISIDQGNIDAIKNTKLTGKITTANELLDWTINGSKNEPQSVADLITKYNKLINVKYVYKNVSYDSLADLLNTPVFDKDESDFISVKISLNPSKNGQIYKLTGSNNNGEIEINISIESLIQMISLSNSKGELTGKDFVDISISNSKKINIQAKNATNLSNLAHSSHLKIVLQKIDKSGNPIGQEVSTLNSLDPGVDYQIIIRTDRNWLMVNSKNPMPNGTNEIKINMLTILEINNPVITKIDGIFEKFNGKGRLTSFQLNSIDSSGKIKIINQLKNHMEVEFSKTNPNGKINWVKWNSNTLNNLSNGEILKVKISPKLGYKFSNHQNILILEVSGLYKEVDLTNIQINKNLNFKGIDSKGSIDKDS